MNSTAFQLVSLPGHLEGAGNAIWSFFYKTAKGELRMQVVAHGPTSGRLDKNPRTYRANLLMARRLWQRFTTNLRWAFASFP